MARVIHLVGISQKFEGFFAVCYTCAWKGTAKISLRDVNTDRQKHLRIVSGNDNSLEGAIQDG